MQPHPLPQPISAFAAPDATPGTRARLRTAEPLLVGATEAARLCGISRDCWRTAVARGATPRPIRVFGRRQLFSLQELREWVASACPPRARWEPLWAARRTMNRTE